MDLSGQAFVVEADLKEYLSSGRLSYKCPLCRKKFRHGYGYEMGRIYKMIDTCIRCEKKKKYQCPGGGGFIGRDGYYVITEHLVR